MPEGGSSLISIPSPAHAPAARVELVPAGGAARRDDLLPTCADVAAEAQPPDDLRVALGRGADGDLGRGHHTVEGVLAIEHRLVLGAARRLEPLGLALARRRLGRGDLPVVLDDRAVAAREEA